jgi:hypothetical protein
LLPTDSKSRRRLLVSGDFGLGAALAFAFGLGSPPYAGQAWPGQALVQEVLAVVGMELMAWGGAFVILWLWGSLERYARIALVAAVALAAFILIGPSAAPVVRLLAHMEPMAWGGLFSILCLWPYWAFRKFFPARQSIAARRARNTLVAATALNALINIALLNVLAHLELMAWGGLFVILCLWPCTWRKSIAARWARIALVAVLALDALILIGLLIGRIAAPVARSPARELPSVFVAACGLWACLLVSRAAKSRRWLRWLAPLPHLIGAATAAASLILLFDRHLLTTEPAAGFLIPLAVWGSISAWLAMKKSERLAVRAAADITLSLLLGAVLVVFLVWLANLLDMPRPEVAVLRAVLAHAGAVVDLPWWVWTALYVLLAVVSLAFVLRPARTATAKQWFGRLRVVPAADATRRVASGVHIGLLAIILVGLSAPAALATTVQHKLAAAYTVALQSKFEAAGELAAYVRIQHQFDGGTAPGTLVQVVMQIHDTDSPPAGDDNPTGNQDDLAQRVGALQATALNLASTKAVLDAAETAARQAGLDAPLNGETDIEDRLAEVSADDQDADTEESSASTAGKLAAVALASTISLPDLGGNEVVQVVREYLSGLVEESGIKDTFARWAQRLPGASPPPTAQELVEPDPAKLQTAAYNELAAEFAAAGEASDIDTDQAVINTITESPITAAVTLANQSIQPDVTGCAGCTSPGGPDDDVVPADDGE